MIQIKNVATKEYSLLGFFLSTLLFICTLALIVAGISSFMAKPWLVIPVPLRFLIGIIVFGLSPGLIVFLLINNKEAEKSILISFLEMITISFGCNLLINIILFISGFSFRQLSIIYVIFQLIMCFHILRKRYFFTRISKP